MKADTKIKAEWLTWRDNTKVGKVFFACLLVMYSAVMLYLFVNQALETPDFVSDMPAYIDKVRGVEGDYEFPYPLLFTLAKAFALVVGAPIGMALATCLLNTMSVYIAKLYLNREVRSYVDYEVLSSRKKAAFEVGLSLLALSLFWLGNLYSPKNTAFFGFDYAYRCMGIYTPNPIWNATYLATRPFTIVCFFEGCKMLREYREDFAWRKTIPFAVSLFLTTITKPSYVMIFLPTVAVILLVQLVMSKGESFRNAFCLCVTMIPTGLHLLYQFGGLFTGVNVKGEETGIGIAFAYVWSNFSKNIPLSIVMGMASPIGVLILNLPEWKKNAYYRFAWWNYLTGMLMFLLLYEKGFRWEHANFSWGYMHGMFFVYLMTLIVMVKNIIQWRKSYKVIFLLAEWGVFLIHLICGVNFQVYALRGLELAGF